jgi:hypothetical protein
MGPAVLEDRSAGRIQVRAGVAADGVEPVVVAQVEQDDAVAGREVDVAHRDKGRADQDVKPLPVGTQKDLHQDRRPGMSCAAGCAGHSETSTRTAKTR